MTRADPSFSGRDILFVCFFMVVFMLFTWALLVAIGCSRPESTPAWCVRFCDNASVSRDGLRPHVDGGNCLCFDQEHGRW